MEQDHLVCPVLAIQGMQQAIEQAVQQAIIIQQAMEQAILMQSIHPITPISPMQVIQLNAQCSI